MRRTVGLYLTICALLIAAWQCFAQSPVPMMGMGTMGPVAAGGGTVTVDVCDTTGAQLTGTSPISYTGPNITSGLTKPAAVFSVNFETNTTATPVSAVSATWNGTNAPIITHTDAANGTASAYLFGIINPTPGVQTFLITFTGGINGLFASGCSWSQVNQTGGATSFPGGTGTTNTSNTSSITVSSATNHAVMAGHIAASTSPTISSVNNTQVYINNAGQEASAANRAAGAATVSMTATLSGSFQWVNAGTDISN